MYGIAALSRGFREASYQEVYVWILIIQNVGCVQEPSLSSFGHTDSRPNTRGRSVAALHGFAID